MRKWFVAAALFACAPCVAFGGAAPRPTPVRESPLWSFTRNAALTVNAGLGGRQFRAGDTPVVQGIAFTVSTAAGTATGSMVLRVTDGSCNRDVTIDCTTSDARATGAKRGEAAGSCVFASGAALTGTVQTACGTAQPTVTNVEVVGFVR